VSNKMIKKSFAWQKRGVARNRYAMFSRTGRAFFKLGLPFFSFSGRGASK